MKVIITGATGMVGRGVLLECLYNPHITNVLVVGRQSVNIQHPKLTEIVHDDLFDVSTIETKLTNYDACFFCIGISSFRMTEQAYTSVTHDLPVSFAKVLLGLNPNMVFHYVSASGADDTVTSKVMWVRVKGKAEQSLRQLGFKDVYIYRPAYIKPNKATPSSTKIYNWLMPLLTLFHPLIVRAFPHKSTTAFDMGRAMIRNTLNASDVKVLESDAMNRAAGLL